MCGINGFNFANRNVIEQMNKSLSHRGPDGNNSSCFQGGSKILSSLPSCQHTLSLQSQAKSTGRLQSHIPGTIWSSPSRYRACGLTAKRGAAGQDTKELYVSLSLSLALLCLVFQLSSD